MEESKLQRAARVAQRLNELTDELNKSFIRIEQLLVQLKLGVEAEIDLPEVGLLSWEKRGSTWHLIVYQGANDTSGTILLKTSRRVRVVAASHLEALIDALCTEIVEQTDAISGALDTTNRNIEMLER